MSGQLIHSPNALRKAANQPGPTGSRPPIVAAVSSKTASAGKRSWAKTSGIAVCGTRPAKATDVPASVAKYQFAKNGINPATRPATKTRPIPWRMEVAGSSSVDGS